MISVLCHPPQKNPKKSPQISTNLNKILLTPINLPDISLPRLPITKILRALIPQYLFIMLPDLQVRLIDVQDNADG